MRDMFVWHTARSKNYCGSKIAMEIASARGITPYEALFISLDNFVPTQRTFEGFDRYFVLEAGVKETLESKYAIPQDKIKLLSITEEDIDLRNKESAELLLCETLEAYFK